MQWYYAKAGVQHGPISESEIRQLIANGTIQQTDNVWNDSMTEWLPLSQVPALSGGGASPYQAPVTRQSASQAAAAATIPTYLWQSICVTLFCCLIGGIIAIVHAAKVDGLKAAGDIAGATEASNKAKTWCMWSFIIGLLVQGAYIALAVTGVLADSGGY